MYQFVHAVEGPENQNEKLQIDWRFLYINGSSKSNQNWLGQTFYMRQIYYKRHINNTVESSAENEWFPPEHLLIRKKQLHQRLTIIRCYEKKEKKK